jgi:diguanylate cyclase (GGDEF)-like protein/PAS domain S-box-containing protein
MLPLQPALRRGAAMTRPRARRSDGLRAERARRTTRDGALDAADVAWWEWTSAGDRWHGSPAWWRLLGHAGGAPSGAASAWRELLHPDDRARVDRAMAALGDGAAGMLEMRLRHADGHFVDVQTHCVGRRARGGAIDAAGISVDAGARRATEIGLQQAKAIIASTREGVMVSDVGGSITLVNEAFTEISGYGADEAVGKTPALLSSGRHDQAFYAAMWAGVTEDGRWHGEIWNRRKNGEIYPELLTISAVGDAAGRVGAYVGVFADMSKAKASEAQLAFIAHYDPLTRLPNRLMFSTLLEHAVLAAQRDGSTLALLIIDLDRFKDLNDSYGHAAGDQVLQQLAGRLGARARTVDRPARLGGDEFALLLEHIGSADDAALVAHELNALCSAPWQLAHGIEVHLGVSIGISVYPAHGDTAAELMQHADAALAHAKHDGSGFHYFTEHLTVAARGRIDLETRLHRAIGQHELRVYYQPQVDLASGRIVGAEALVRWQDPSEGLISPARFIPVAEMSGLIHDIGAWVLRETCAQGQRWIAAGLPPLTLAVNLSPRQFLHGNVEALVATVLRETGFPAGRLELELTESALMAHERDAEAMLARLRATGVRLALDDFGTGYSSLSYLKRFPFDVLKIDKSFVDSLPVRQDDAAIAVAIIAIGHTLGFQVLAEGVETPAQRDFLRHEGCDLFQGYLRSPPVPAEAFAALLAAQV